MSYDLFIVPRQFELGAIIAWFEQRPYYAVSDVRALYSNPDTGTYFSFDLEAGPAPMDDAGGSHLLFNMNYFRPHTFALEAEPEVAAFLSRFASAIHDPQTGGMGDGPYSRTGFLDGWNAGNRFGFKIIGAKSNPPPPWPADPRLIEAIWKWNYERVIRQESAGDDIFVPAISWFLPIGGTPVSASVWTKGVPTVLSEAATHVVLVRQPRRGLLELLGLAAARADAAVEIRLVPISEVARVAGTSRREIDGQTLLHTATDQSKAVEALFSGAWLPNAMTGVAAENICGTDLIDLMA